MDDIDVLVQNAIMEKPLVFKIDKRVFYIYPLTLGKMFIMQRISKELDINIENVEKNATVEFLFVVKEKRERCCDLLAYMTARNDYYDVFDNKEFEKRKKVFMKQEDGDIAALVINLLTSDKTDEFIKHLGVDKEQEYMRKVLSVKEKGDKNNYTFGGVSLYGSLLDVAMERYGFSKRQVVWEIDYTSLRLLLADRVNSIYVSDEERKRIHIPKDRVKVSGDNKEEMLNIIRSQSWE